LGDSRRYGDTEHDGEQCYHTPHRPHRHPSREAEQ
jgi:hypothetical protein